MKNGEEPEPKQKTKLAQDSRKKLSESEDKKEKWKQMLSKLDTKLTVLLKLSYFSHI